MAVITHGQLRIYKYHLGRGRTGEACLVEMPEGANILDIQIQRNQVVVWAVVNIEAEIISRWFRIFGTGWDIPQGLALNHISTIQTSGGLVWHIFEEVLI